MKRKGLNPGDEPQSIPDMVKIHNSVNERCWSKVAEYENYHLSICANSKLKSFRGRAQDFTIRAKFWNLFGYQLPFDRHDWVVDRCGKEVSYILDFYSCPGEGADSVALDIRPAFSLEGVMDRAKMFFKEITGSDYERKKYLTRIKSTEHPHTIPQASAQTIKQEQTTKQEPINPHTQNVNTTTDDHMLVLLPPHLQQVFNSCKGENDTWFKCLGITKVNSEINEAKIDECQPLLQKIAECQKKAREKLKTV